MKERPIDLRAHEASAAAKGELRLIVRQEKLQPSESDMCVGLLLRPRGKIFGAFSECGEFGVKCPYGQPGDALWGREAWQAIHVYRDPETGCGEDVAHADTIPASDMDGWWSPVYAATDPHANDIPEDRGFRWRSPVTMPRWASRWSRQIEHVEFRRVQSITEAEAMACGLDLDEKHAHWFAEGEHLQSAGSPMSAERYAFMRLWQSIHGRDSWDANEWCWFVWVEPTKGSCDP